MRKGGLQHCHIPPLKLPNRYGRSRHGSPVWARQSTAPGNSLMSAAVTPGFGRLAGQRVLDPCPHGVGQHRSAIAHSVACPFCQKLPAPPFRRSLGHPLASIRPNRNQTVNRPKDTMQEKIQSVKRGTTTIYHLQAGHLSRRNGSVLQGNLGAKQLNSTACRSIFLAVGLMIVICCQGIFSASQSLGDRGNCGYETTISIPE